MNFTHRLHKLLPLILISISILFSNSAKADEGMWLISLIGKNIETMQRMGLKLSEEDIYSINKSSLKDAVVSLDDGGCSAEIISPKGLILTNHHCGVGDIQFHSTPEQNLLRDGFWAKSIQEELPVPGKTALILLRVEDVTKQILSKVDTTDADSAIVEMINTAILEYQTQVEIQEKGVHALVVPMFNYNQYYLFVYHRFTDVRLVGAPPAAIGNFGGDVDNWHWPRHTGDFCLFRIYSGPDGLPADYSKKNVPYKPKHHFPISLSGVNEGDFTMIIGYPGTTYRYASSAQAIHARDFVAPWVNTVWGEFIGTIKDEMKNDAKIKVNYTDMHDMLVNFWQKDTWQAESMFQFNVVERLKAREDSLVSWANKNSTFPQFFTNATPAIDSYYSLIQRNGYEELFRSLSALSSWPVSIGNNISSSYNLFVELTNEKPSRRRIRKETKALNKELPEIFDDFFPQLDSKLYSIALKSVINYLPDSTEYPVLKKIQMLENREAYIPFVVDAFYQNSCFSSQERMREFIRKPNIDTLLADPIFYLHLTAENLMAEIQSRISPMNPTVQRAHYALTKGILQMEKDELHYPDANSTMRLTYGKVIGYRPADGVYYRPLTYAEGILEKEDNSVDVFNLPPKLKELLLKKDFGGYASDGKLPVCFLTDNDITNGNSGSGVLNAKGELIGVAFDGNNEAMACDYMYEPDYQRTIIADIRYVLFVIDKFAGASNLIEEMTIAEIDY